MTIQQVRYNYKLKCLKHNCFVNHGIYSKKKEYKQFHILFKGQFKYCPLCIQDYENSKDKQLLLFID